MLVNLLLSHIADVCQGELVGPDQLVEHVVTDTRKITEKSLFIALVGERFDGHDYAQDALEQGSVAVLSQQDLAITCYVKVENTVTAYGQLARYIRDQFTGPVVCITGSNGKTTVKDWLAQSVADKTVLKTLANLNNQIGVPQTLFGLRPDHELAIVETGTSYPGEIERLASIAHPDVVILTNASGSHFEGFGNLQGIAIEKGQLISGSQPNAVVVLNRDDGFFDYWHNLAQGRKVLAFGFTNAADLWADEVALAGDYSDVTLHYDGLSEQVRVAMPGKHQIANGMAIVLAMLALGYEFSVAVQQLSKPSVVAGRLERLCTKNGALLINDCYNASPSSVEAAIDVLVMQNATGSWLILGALGELGDQWQEIHAALGRYAASKGVKNLVCVGEVAAIAGRAFEQSGGKAVFCHNHQDAAKQVQELNENHAILVKGSRSAKMENVIKALIN
ncbi:UDP-N-acetylmuramoyl-tripeptide--D-alanyl-D-alanine ligase [Marinomonas epiphytica]